MSVLFSTTTCGSWASFFVVGRQFAVDDRVIVHRVAARRAGHVNQMAQQPGPLDMAQELMPQADAFARAFDQPGNVGDHKRPLLVHAHDAQDWAPAS